MSETLVAIRCRGSGTLLGFGPADFRIYADPVDAEVEAVGQNEERDSLIYAFSKFAGMNNTQLAKYFTASEGKSLSRQRIQQILRDRQIR
jgi:hypothetical protein